MHFIATYLFFFIDYAFKTSENVPSPFLLINLYSIKYLMYKYSAFRSYFLFTQLTLFTNYNKINVSTKIYNFYLIFLNKYYIIFFLLKYF